MSNNVTLFAMLGTSGSQTLECDEVTFAEKQPRTHCILRGHTDSEAEEAIAIWFAVVPLLRRGIYTYTVRASLFHKIRLPDDNVLL